MNTIHHECIYQTEKVVNDNIRVVGRVMAYANRKLVNEPGEKRSPNDSFEYQPGVITFIGSIHEGRKEVDFTQYWMGFASITVFEETVAWSEGLQDAMDKAKAAVDEEFIQAVRQHEWVSSRLVDLPPEDR